MQRRLRQLLTLLIGAGASALLLTLWQPRFVLRLLQRLNPRVLFFVDTAQRLAALTFDDGPHPTLTPRILDVLAEYQAHATFFLIAGRIPGNEALVHRLVREGHEVGNHHLSEAPSIRLSPPAFEQQLLDAHSLISAFGAIRWFRPGSGWFSHRMLDQLGRYGYQCVLGSAYLEDNLPWAWYLARHILLNTRPGSIIILHDGNGGRERTVTVLRRILPVLQRRGYQVVTVSELVASTQNAVDGRDDQMEVARSDGR